MIAERGMMNSELNKSPNSVWAAAPENFELAQGEVHVWYEDFALLQAVEINQNLQVLALDEIEKAQRFRFEKDRQNYINARSWLRKIIGKYLRISPGLLQFGYGEYGKPWLMNEEGNPHSLQFNLSHSEGVAICALAWEKPLGIDVEALRFENSYDSVAENFFSQNERLALQTVASEFKQIAFFNCWTRKEAYLKARGDGLIFPLDEFDVSLNFDEAKLLSVHHFPEENQRWTLYHLNPKPNFVGALAVEGKPTKIQFFTNYSAR
jgi:4'-phosphopantetheinyl transferase